MCIRDSNQPIQKDPIDILTKLQSPDSDQRLQLMQQMMYQQPHELSPILQLDTYLEVEKKKEIEKQGGSSLPEEEEKSASPVSYTHLRAHETSLHLVCRLLLEKKKIIRQSTMSLMSHVPQPTIPAQPHRGTM
eukprot:TRINITY_DN27576_c0_g1_i2.p1 TRINITY_DN27576_c0_g1~~TRINITY_DN27576_c0_g1_i2.p1  ORF type:complete len:133 (-),score=29.58 TRINITY_DN27576_c0_g1_i2:7-405(-)